MDIHSLNESFALPDELSFVPGPGDLGLAELTNAHGTASVCLHGAHVLGYQPADSDPVLWVSGEARFEDGVAIRGGVPICWPWFGPHPTDGTKPSHGFARTRSWGVKASESLGPEGTRLVLALTASPETEALWPQAFEVQVEVTLGAQLSVVLETANPGEQAFDLTSALHSYFAVSKASAIRIEGLEGDSYVDSLDGDAVKTQDGPVTIGEEVDRIYRSNATCRIVDPGLDRTIVIEKSGSGSSVVWNPWIDKAARMGDFGNEEYHEMVCVETTNAGEDAIQLEPGKRHRLGTRIGLV